MNIKILVMTALIPCVGYCQEGSVYRTYKYNNGSTNSSHGSIFNKPFEDYKYRTTTRGIEVYKTYNDGTNNTMFSKPFPDFIIKDNGKIYKTYTHGTNQTIFTKPFEDAGIAVRDVKTGILNQKKTYDYSKIKYNNTESSANIRYNGESFNSSDNPTYNGE